MTFSQRERFIYHATTLMTMSNLGRLTKSDLQKNLKVVQNKKCTGLTDDQVEEIFFDVEYEALEMMRNAQEKLEKSCAKRQGYKKREFAEDIQEDFK